MTCPQHKIRVSSQSLFSSNDLHNMASLERNLQKTLREMGPYPFFTNLILVWLHTYPFSHTSWEILELTPFQQISAISVHFSQRIGKCIGVYVVADHHDWLTWDSNWFSRWKTMSWVILSPSAKSNIQNFTSLSRSAIPSITFVPVIPSIVTPIPLIVVITPVSVVTIIISPSTVPWRSSLCLQPLYDSHLQ